MEIVEGYVAHVVYRNEENGYTVFHLETEDGEVTCVGSFAVMNLGERLELQGAYINHSVYGTQLKVERFSVKAPEDVVSIERYLGSGAIKGIGAALAGRIVKKFKEKTFEIIEKEPERLAEIKGISERKARDIAIQVADKKDLRQAMIYLQKYNISTTLAAKIYQHYGSKIYQVLEENPYQIADHIVGVGFKTVDEIAIRGGIQLTSEFRIRSGILYMLNQAIGEGHVYLPQDILQHRTGQLLGFELEEIDGFIMDLAMDRKIVKKVIEEEARVYTAHFYYLELRVAKMLHDLDIQCEMPEDLIEKRLKEVEIDKNILLDITQRQGVVEAIKHGLMILTGGPGTGKTTTINAMIRFFENEGMSIALAAPTGRAAKRMTEATGFEAQTIHRLLEVNGNPEDESSGGFQKGQENPLEVDVIIIDEMSMVDLNLMDALLAAVIPGTRLILVGDVNQLPSVGPGSVLKDIISSKRFPVVTLTRIFRQAEESDIVMNAHKINAGQKVMLDNKSKDFFFLRRDNPDMIIRVMLSLIQEKLPKYVEAKPLEIQVMTPTRKGVLGVERLNQVLQTYLNPEKPGKEEIAFLDRIFRVGDKVMQIKNNYQLEWEVRTKSGMAVDCGMGIFNGDMGIIKRINTYEEVVEVEYDEGRVICYPYEALVELEHAYAITVHKSQGSEYPAVVIPLLSGPRLLFNRNLLYTAVTRAKKCLTIVGSEQVFQEMIQNQREHSRYTGLRERILEF
ncbi:MAG: ATP-dependent RecD-like DNA helicase [Lachnospiraceae bacterium]|nr:ATP-dependent RecD-like DNA helicase [Lachnospiraceae bacterium]